MTIEAAIGLTVKEARLARQWSIAELARRIGVSAGTMCALENGRPFAWSTIRDTAQALKMSPGALISLAERIKDQMRKAGLQ